jgi:hypothetical protein
MPRGSWRILQLAVPALEQRYWAGFTNFASERNDY